MRKGQKHSTSCFALKQCDRNRDSARKPNKPESRFPGLLRQVIPSPSVAGYVRFRTGTLRRLPDACTSSIKSQL